MHLRHTWHQHPCRHGQLTMHAADWSLPQLTGAGRAGPRSPGPAVVPPTAARALEKKVAMFCSLAVGGRPPTYTLRACRVACWLGGCTTPAQHLLDRSLNSDGGEVAHC